MEEVCSFVPMEEEVVQRLKSAAYQGAYKARKWKTKKAQAGAFHAVGATVFDNEVDARVYIFLACKDLKDKKRDLYSEPWQYHCFYDETAKDKNGELARFKKTKEEMFEDPWVVELCIALGTTIEDVKLHWSPVARFEGEAVRGRSKTRKVSKKPSLGEPKKRATSSEVSRSNLAGETPAKKTKTVPVPKGSPVHSLENNQVFRAKEREPADKEEEASVSKRKKSKKEVLQKWAEGEELEAEMMAKNDYFETMHRVEVVSFNPETQLYECRLLAFDGEEADEWLEHQLHRPRPADRDVECDIGQAVHFYWKGRKGMNGKLDGHAEGVWVKGKVIKLGKGHVTVSHHKWAGCKEKTKKVERTNLRSAEWTD